MKNPKVSVIIPTYNREKFLERAINSVLSQSLKDYEIIIIDDASTDNTSNIVKSEYPKLKLITLKQNKGAAVARNEGIKKAKGKYIAFLDSDDIWHKNHLKILVKELEKNPDAILSYCDYVEIKENKKTIYHKEPINKKDLKYSMLFGTFITSLSLVVISKDKLIKAGLFNESLRISEDAELYLRLLNHGKFIHIKEILTTKYSQHDNLIHNYKLYTKEKSKEIDIVLSKKENKKYKHLKNKLKAHHLLTLAEYKIMKEKDIYAVSYLIISSLKHSIYRTTAELSKLILNGFNQLLKKIKIK